MQLIIITSSFRGAFVTYQIKQYKYSNSMFCFANPKLVLEDTCI